MSVIVVKSQAELSDINTKMKSYFFEGVTYAGPTGEYLTKGEFIKSSDVMEELLLQGQETSTTAKKIYDYLHNNKAIQVYIITVKGIMDCHFADPDDEGDAKSGEMVKKPSVVIDIDMISDLAFINPRDKWYTKVPPVVALYHELGHAKQYFTWGRSTYLELAKVGLGGSGEFPNRKLMHCAILESDNMKFHEYPICDELKVAKRDTYRFAIEPLSKAVMRSGFANV